MLKYRKLKLLFAVLLIGILLLPLMASEKNDIPEEILNPPYEPDVCGHTISEIYFNKFLRLFGSFHTRRIDAERKNCFEKQRIIIGAIELYNMEHYGTEIKTLGHHFTTNPAKLLISSKLLRKPMKMVNSKCEYASYGDLTTDGVVYCKFHGSVNSEKLGISMKKCRPVGIIDEIKHFVIIFIWFILPCVLLGLFLNFLVHKCKT